MDSENSQYNYPIAKAVPQRDMVSEEDYPIAEAVPHHDTSEYETDEGLPLLFYPALAVVGLTVSFVGSAVVVQAGFSLFYLAKKLGYFKSGEDICREMWANSKR